jgi:colicin import membrane protein
MVERSNDRWVSLAQSIVLHGAIIAVVGYGYWAFKQRDKPAVAETLGIEAVALDSNATKPVKERRLPPPPPAPEPEPEPEPVGPPTPTSEEVAQREEDEKRIALQKEAEERRIAEEKVKRETLERDEAERQKREVEAKRVAEQKRLAETKRKEEERKKADEARLRQQREQQWGPGSSGVDRISRVSGLPTASATRSGAIREKLGNSVQTC